MPTDLPIRRWLNVVVPVGVIGLLLAVIVPALRQAGETARRTQARNDLKQWGLAIHNYESTFNVLPLGANVDEAGVAHHGWPVRLIPYLASTPLYNQIDLNQPWDSPANEPLMRGEMYGELSVFVSTPVVSPEGYGLIHYATNPNAMHRNHCITFDEMTAGAAATFLLGEAAGDFLPWGYPYQWRPLGDGVNQAPAGYGLPGRPITHFVMADGSVRSLSSDVDPKVLQTWRIAPPIAAAEQVALPPRPAKFRSTGARRTTFRVNSYLADVRVFPQTGNTDISIRLDKGSHPDDPPTPETIRSQIVERFPQCTSLSIDRPLDRDLALALSSLRHLKGLEVDGLRDLDEVILILEKDFNLQVLRVDGLSESVAERLRKELPDVLIATDSR